MQDLTYEYRVAAVDSNKSEGTKSVGVSVNIASPFAVVDTMGIRGLSEGQLNGPCRIAIDMEGYLYIVDSSYSRIQVFDSTGSFIRRFRGTHRNVSGIWVDSDTNVFLAGSGRIHKFARNGDPLLVIDTNAVGSCEDLVTDANENIYVISQIAGEGQLVKFDPLGNLLKKWSTGYALTVAIDTGSVLYVGGDGFIQSFSTDGALLRSWEIPLALGGQQYRSIWDIVVYKGVNVVISEIGSDQLFIYNEQGDLLAKGGAFLSLIGIAVGGNGYLYGVEVESHRILKIALP
jgi:DNA-binding beta-propeller fold protein YncE